jgi:hypothetical protein
MKYTSNLKRTSMSLDTDTLDSIESLAQKWQTSKSEVIRRIVKKAKSDEIIRSVKMTPVEALEAIRAGAGLNEEEAKFLSDEVAAERAAKKYWWEENDSAL